MVTVAFGAAITRDLVQTGLNATNEAGRAIVNYAKGADKTEVQINFSGLVNGATYNAYFLCPDPAGWIPIGSCTGKKNGKGQIHGRPSTDCSGYEIHVALVLPDGSESTVLVWTP